MPPVIQKQSCVYAELGVQTGENVLANFCKTGWPTL
jgi:hypothetical protein